MSGFPQVKAGRAYSREGNAGSTGHLQKSSYFRKEVEVGKRVRSGLISCGHLWILTRNVVKTSYGRFTQFVTKKSNSSAA